MKLIENKFNKIEQNFYYLYMGYPSNALDDTNSFIGISLLKNDTNNYNPEDEYNESPNNLSSNFFVSGLKTNDIILVCVKDKNNNETHNICKVKNDFDQKIDNYYYIKKVEWILKNISCDYLLEEIKKYKNTQVNAILVGINHFKNQIMSLINNKNDLYKGKNVILYGIPGCGKSHKVKKEYIKNANNYNVERVVFHPDYTYSDFIGQIMPRVEENTLSYQFVPGPFTKILKKAILDETENFYLVIEEINRGNAPAILGDIFQLLDRDNLGFSEYQITNQDIARFVFNDENKHIYLPHNLTIIATMNTSDQNVFTLDTAFQRRWNMELIKNNADSCLFKNKRIVDTDVEWLKFVDTINKEIASKNSFEESIADKRLGYFFIKEFELADSKKFAAKVLKYLWDDAFKYKRDKLFKTIYTQFEDIVKDFTEKKKNERFDIFIEDIKK